MIQQTTPFTPLFQKAIRLAARATMRGMEQISASAFVPLPPERLWLATQFVLESGFKSQFLREGLESRN